MSTIEVSAVTSSEPREPTMLAPSELRYLVLAVQREGNRQLNQLLAPLGLTASQAEIILVLHEFGPITLKELGDLIICEVGGPSRIVETLVKRELVTRIPDERDRRAVSLSLTSSGKALVPSLLDLDRGINAGALERLTDDQLAGLVSSMRAVLSTTNSHDILERRFASRRTLASDLRQ
ncbi:MarR family winged helix-turn-helix transcriptional regulator [Microbacterium sp. SORGH_AS_0888]|uniref:MarR family winged helix-turn-helix transcriptional regulator n=1 Tax=Microbacterium sp. SORGH_AS_0888 TaxID=3041791 RepID=UPI00278497AC|nr:MarR family transcriptional regulator [Microbacterium sp. SORGH_AS_0888]MDQ1131040.1 DNA-binding MarR family transcriptional regulator [Microbacterium sp. SORGH_AS_0888]